MGAQPDTATSPSGAAPLSGHDLRRHDRASHTAKAEPMRRRSDFDGLMRADRPRQHRLFSLRLRPNQLGRVRYGFAVRRQIGGAVVRNRVRRRFREVVRQLPPGDGFDLLLVARSSCVQASYDEIETAIRESVTRHPARVPESR